MEKDYSKEYASAARDFANRVSSKLKDQICSVILFGSVARGQADPDSDIDILVVLKNASRTAKNKVYDIALDVQLERKVPLAVKIYAQRTFNELNQKKTPFMRFIKSEGKTL